MNDKLFARDPPGFSRIAQTLPMCGYETPAAKRRKKFTRVAVAECLGPVLLRFVLDSGSGETISKSRALLYVPANTGLTVGFHPRHFIPWNERRTPCI